MRPVDRPLAVAVLGRGVIDPDEPVIHADDAGLLRGSAAFETLRVYGGAPFAMPEHLERLAASAERLHLEPPPSSQLVALAEEALRAAAVADVALRFTLTGGRPGGAPVAVAVVTPLPPDLELVRAAGISAVSLQLGIDPRLRGDAPWLLDGVKTTSYAVNMAAWDEARRRGADDALFVAADGSVLEGPVTNMWWRHGRSLRTPALDLGILAGVTRAYVVRLAGELGYTVEQGWYPLRDLAVADEAFTSSSIRELMPVTRLDGGLVGAGRPGDAARDLQRALRRMATSSA